MVSSGGGHWVELIRLLPALEGCDATFVTVQKSYRLELGEYKESRFYVVADITRWNRFKWMLTAIQILIIILHERPEVIVSTGALPGFFALRIGKVFGARTVWVDSIANVDELSRSGEKIGKHADLWLTQWPDLAREDGPRYKGAVL